MKNYTKPLVLMNEELSEGVYAASGDCYTVTYNMHQKPEVDRGDYRIQINGSHNAVDDHHSGEQVLIITFNQPVTYSWSNGILVSGDGTNTLRIKFNYHNNGRDSIGLGDLVVVSDSGLTVTGVVLTCNYNCGQH